jgi:hypothetical protein
MPLRLLVQVPRSILVQPTLVGEGCDLLIAIATDSYSLFSTIPSLSRDARYYLERVHNSPRHPLQLANLTLTLPFRQEEQPIRHFLASAKTDHGI